MAAYSALLAVQYAAGVPAARCQLRRNLVTKTTIIAANPAARYEASYLVSAPSPLRTRSVTKRDKTIVAAYPGTAEIQTSGFPELTDCVLRNDSGNELKLDSEYFWAGSPKVYGTNVDSIPTGTNATFEHLADSNGSLTGSIAGVGYKIDDASKWIVAWRNSTNESNKVYTEIIDGVVDWGKIKNNLDQAGDNGSAEHSNYTSKVEIGRTSAKPRLTATLTVKNAGNEAGQ